MCKKGLIFMLLLGLLVSGCNDSNEEAIQENIQQENATRESIEKEKEENQVQKEQEEQSSVSNFVSFQQEHDNVEDYLLEVFSMLPPSPNISEQEVTTEFTTTYIPTTDWGDLDPLRVHHATLEHVDEQSEHVWSLGIGKGGQIYSFRTEAGELIPPQNHPKGAQWIDEVFQMVAVDTVNNDTSSQSTMAFIHQAGTYNKDEGYLDHSWYSPMLVNKYEQENNAFTAINWAPYSHIPAIYKSNVLYYTKYTNLGEGVIQVDQLFTNAGDYTFDWFNAPWGGVRNTTLPHNILSNWDGTMIEKVRPSTVEERGRVKVEQNYQMTEGWLAWTQNENADSLGLGLVFGKDQQLLHQKKSPFVRFFWYTGDKRDYSVVSAIIPVIVNPGQTFHFRYFYVVGTREEIEQKGKELAEYATYGPLEVTTENTGLIPLKMDQQSENGIKQTVLSVTSSAEADFLTYAFPVKNSLPIYLMRNTETGKLFISHDPYYLSSTDTYEGHTVYRPYDGKTEYLGLYGYALPEDQVNEDELSSHIALEEVIEDEEFYPASDDSVTLMVKKAETK